VGACAQKRGPRTDEKGKPVRGRGEKDAKGSGVGLLSVPLVFYTLFCDTVSVKVLFFVLTR